MMDMDIEYTNTIKFFFLDASVLVKLVLDEPQGGDIRKIAGTGTLYTTQMCVYEAYGVIKRKWKKKGIDDEQYIKANYSLSGHIRNGLINIVESSLENIDDFRRANDIIEQYTKSNGEYLIDLSDALQLVTLKHGFFSLFGGRPLRSGALLRSGVD